MSPKISRVLGTAIIGALTISMSTFLIRATATPGQVNGVVFEDFNQNGVREATEPGIANVTVTTTDSTGAAKTAVTAADGSYNVSGLTGQQRVEFSNAPMGLLPSAHGAETTGTVNATTVQFANTGDSINAAFADPNDYCQNNPKYVVACMFGGDPGNPNAAGRPSLKIAPWGGGASSPLVPIPATGTILGIAAQSPTRVFSAAFVKRHTGLGTLGAGGIYVTNPATGATSPFVDVSALGIPIGSVPSNAARGLNEPNAPNTDADVFYQVGTAGLGDIDMSDDGRALWVVSLAGNSLHRIDLPADGSAPTAPAFNAGLGSVACAKGIERPFGVKPYRGKVYVGVVCTAELGGTKADMTASVVAYDIATSSWSTVFGPFSLDYAKGCANGPATYGCGWNPWKVAPYVEAEFDFRSWGGVFYNQAMLSDIEFDTDGSMVLGLRDRGGDQFGYGQNRPSGTFAEDNRSGGDILRVCNVAGTFTLQGGAGCANNAANNQGPGGGEFYPFDKNDQYGHEETSLGMTELLKTEPSLGVNAYAVSTLYEGGTGFYDAKSGALTGVSRHYASEAPGEGGPAGFGKANGIGDIEALCEAAPIEIGNRIWSDNNGDGIQSADDPGIGGVAVELYRDGVLIATTTSAADGTYYFNSGNVTLGGAAGIVANTDYVIRIPNASGAAPQAALVGLKATTANVSGNANDTIDSDAVASTTTPTSVVILVPAASISRPGQNNHTFDAGFAPQYSLGNRVWIDNGGGTGGVANDGVQNGTEVGLKDVKVVLFASDANGSPTGPAIGNQTTDANGFYRFDNLAPGMYVVVIDQVGSPALNGLVSSTGAANTVTDVTDKNDNGIDVPLAAGSVLPGGIASGKITVGPGMPTGETDLPVGGVPDSAIDARSNQQRKN
jgi:SdrD B-like domain